MTWRQWLETIRAYAANEEPRSPPCPHPRHPSWKPFSDGSWQCIESDAYDLQDEIVRAIDKDLSRRTWVAAERRGSQTATVADVRTALAEMTIPPFDDEREGE